MTISDQHRSWAFEVANLEQAGAWDGEEGEDWTVHADRYDAACRRYDPALLGGAGIAEDDRVLDIGCGAGISSRDAARVAVAGHVLGIDLSARLIEEARRRSQTAGATNTAFIQGDGQVHHFERAAFDVGISRFGAMFFGDPVAAFGNIARATRPRGRLALLAWQEFAKNEWLRTIRGALRAGRTLPEPTPGPPGPFGLADKTTVARVASEAGYDSIAVNEVNEPMYLGADADDAFAFVSGLGVTRGLLSGLDDKTKAAALDELHARLSRAAGSEGVLLGSSAWLITARRPATPGRTPAGRTER